MGTSESNLTFLCDAMCGGLARWLRAIGYDAAFHPDLDDAELVQLAHRQGRVLISSDGKLFERRAITERRVRALQLPRGLKRIDQIRFVVRALGLTVRDPRCMKCNGRLIAASREEVADVVPARSLVWADAFFRCDSCHRVFWNGTHWKKITARRAELALLASDPPAPPGPQP